MHLVAVHGLTADELTFPLFIPLDGLDLLGNILGIHVVHDSTERGNVIGRRLHASVDAVQQRNVAHSLFREVTLHIMAGHNIVTPQTGKVFGNDHVDLLGFNVSNHALEVRAVKTSTAPTVIDIGIIDG